MKLRRIYRLAHGVGWFWILLGVGVIAGMLLSTALVGIPRAEHPPIFGPHSLEFLDLAAQRSMSDAAWWMVWLTGASALVGAGSLVLIAWTLKQAIRSADYARDAVAAAQEATATNREMGFAQSRAYLVVENPKLVPIGKEPPEVTIKIRNSGQTPAFDVRLIAKVFFSDKLDEWPDNSIMEYRVGRPDITVGGDNVFTFAFGSFYRDMFEEVIARTDAFMMINVDVIFVDAFDEEIPRSYFFRAHMGKGQSIYRNVFDFEKLILLSRVSNQG